MYNMSPTSTEGLGDCLRREASDLSLLSWLTLRVWRFCTMSSGSYIGNCQYVNRSPWVSISQASKSPCWIDIMTDTGHQTITAERIPPLQWGQSSVRSARSVTGFCWHYWSRWNFRIGSLASANIKLRIAFTLVGLSQNAKVAVRWGLALKFLLAKSVQRIVVLRGAITVLEVPNWGRIFLSGYKP